MQIKGFTPLQQEIANLVWQFQTSDEIVNWFQSCDDEIKPVAHAVICMLKYEYIDSQPINDFTDAQEIINRVKEL